jgi:O-antigen ligase
LDLQNRKNQYNISYEISFFEGNLLKYFLKLQEKRLYVNYLIMAYAFVLPISRAGINIFGALLLFALIFLGGIKEKTDRLNRTYLAVFLLGIFMLVSFLWSKNIKYATSHTLIYLQYFLISFAIYIFLDKEFIKKVEVAFLLGLTASEIIAFLIFFHLIHKANVNYNDPAPFMNHIEYSIYLCIGMIIAIRRLFVQKLEVVKKIAYFTFFTVSIILMCILHGFTGQLAFVAVFPLSIILYIGLNPKGILVGILSGMLLVFVWYNGCQGFHKKSADLVKITDSKPIDSCSSFGVRLGMITVGLDILEHNTIAGVGMGDPMVEFRDYVGKKYPKFRCALVYNQLHNQYVQFAVQLGLLGLSLFFAIFYFLFKESRDKKFALLIIIGIMISCVGDSLFTSQFSIALIGLMFTLILRFSEYD